MTNHRWSKWPLSIVRYDVRGETVSDTGTTVFRVDEDGILHVSKRTDDHFNEVELTFRLTPVQREWVEIDD